MTGDSFGSDLRRYRRNARDGTYGGPLSQKRLADLLSEASGIVYSRGAISDWERGKGHIHKDARHVLVCLIKVLYDAGGLTTLPEVNGWLAAGNYRRLNAAERAQVAAAWAAEASGTADDMGRPIFLPPMLPAHPIIGRQTIVEELKARLFAGGTLALSAINGLPGIGKTALAILLAHDPEVGGYFSDGILWAGLGPDPDIFNILGRWATVLDLDETVTGRLGAIRLRANAIHEAIGQRRLLLVIDDVWNPDHAAHFRLGGPACGHVLTSRQPQIAASFAGEHALSVRELSSDQGLALLRSLAPGVVEREPELARILVEATGGLPLALVLLGNDLRRQSATQSDRRIRAALENLRAAEKRFALQMTQPVLERQSHPSLPADAQISLRTVIGVSEAHLSAAQSNALRALGLFPPKPNSFSEEAALAVTGATLEILDALTDCGLLELNGRGRYTLHQAICEYARLENPEAAATLRLADYYLAFVERHQTAPARLERELENIKSVLDSAQRAGRVEAMWPIVNVLFPFLEEKGHYALAQRYLELLAEKTAVAPAAVRYYQGRLAIRQGDTIGALASWEAGLTAAQRDGDHERAIALLSNLSLLASQNGDPMRATAYLQEVTRHARTTGNWDELCRALGNMGRLAYTQDAYQDADAYLVDALTVARQHGLESLASGILNLRGIVAKARGAHDAAGDHFLAGLHIARRHRLGARLSTLLVNMGQLRNEQRRYEEASAYLLEGLALARQLGDRSQESHLLMDLGLAAAGLGRSEEALAHLEAGHSLALALENRWLEAYIGAHRGHVTLQLGRLPEAQALLERSLELAPAINPSAVVVGLAHYGLAHIALAAGQRERAAAHSSEALRAFEQGDIIRAAEVGAWRVRHALGSGDPPD